MTVYQASIPVQCVVSRRRMTLNCSQLSMEFLVNYFEESGCIVEFLAHCQPTTLLAIKTATISFRTVDLCCLRFRTLTARCGFEVSRQRHDPTLGPKTTATVTRNPRKQVVERIEKEAGCV